VWDDLNTHVSRAMAGLVVARPWLTGGQLPPYASELNPVEGAWSTMKGGLGNLGSCSIPAPARRDHEEPLKRIQYRTGLIDGFLARPDSASNLKHRSYRPRPFNLCS
jgi:transposase